MCVRLMGDTMIMVNTLDSGPSGPGSSPGRGHCVVFLGKTLNSHSAPFHLCVQLDFSEFNAGGNPAIYLPLLCVRIILHLLCLSSLGAFPLFLNPQLLAPSLVGSFAVTVFYLLISILPCLAVVMLCVCFFL